MPLFDEDLEADGLPADVVAVQERIRAADGVLLATPEYNFGVPGPVKNFVDWASRPPGGGAFVGKPVALIGASTGRVGGTVQAQGQLRISLAVIGAHVMPSPPILVAEAHTRFDEELLIDEPTDKILGIALSRFLDFIDALGPQGTGRRLWSPQATRSACDDDGVVGTAARGGVEQGEAGDDAVEVGDHASPGAARRRRGRRSRRTNPADTVVVADGPEVRVEPVRPLEVDARRHAASWYRPVLTLVLSAGSPPPYRRAASVGRDRADGQLRAGSR